MFYAIYTSLAMTSGVRSLTMRDTAKELDCCLDHQCGALSRRILLTHVCPFCRIRKATFHVGCSLTWTLTVEIVGS